MYFCFDVMEEENETVALTCPHKKLTKSLAKCCPQGQIINDGANGYTYSITWIGNLQPWPFAMLTEFIT